MTTTTAPLGPGGFRAVLRGMTVLAAAAFALLAAAAAVAALVAVCAGLLAEVAERLATAGMTAAATVRDTHHDQPTTGARWRTWTTATAGAGGERR